MEELPRNVAALVKPPPLARVERAYWTPEQAAQFMEGVGDAVWAVPFLVMLGTGIRIGECLALTWADVDLVGGWLVIRRTMTEDANGKRIFGDEAKSEYSRRRIKLDGRTLEVLKRHREREPVRGRGGLLFQGDIEGKPPAANTMQRRWKVLLDGAGLSGTITPHGLRHTHATLLLAAGVDVKTVSQRLGHASVSFTLDLYSHVLDEMQGRAVDVWDDVLLPSVR
jgi:integrase